MRRIVADISTHTLTWSVTWHGKECSPCGFHFNSHAHVERDQIHASYILSRSDFNSHAHVERDLRFSSTRAILRISTHTLTWSVTCACFFKSSGRRISTHTLTWSVTSLTDSVHLVMPFQLTRSRGA